MNALEFIFFLTKQNYFLNALPITKFSNWTKIETRIVYQNMELETTARVNGNDSVKGMLSELYLCCKVLEIVLPKTISCEKKNLKK